MTAVPLETRERLDRPALTRDELAALVARDIAPGSVVNLGIGLPTRVSDHLNPAGGVVLHTENGLLGMGPEAHGDEIDDDLVNAGKIPVTELPGGAADAIPAVGGAMDLATGARDVFVMMTPLAKDGAPKLVRDCTYPLTGLHCVSRVYTEQAVFLIGPDRFVVRETFGTLVARLRELLGVPLDVLA